MRWADGEVTVTDAVRAPKALSGARLRDGFFKGIAALTLGLIRTDGRAIYLGPVELLRFGAPEASAHAVTWPVEGGLLSAGPGGRLEIRSGGGTITATVEGYRPSLPRALYAIGQLPAHHLLTQLVLLRLRGRSPAAGLPAEPAGRLAAGLIDVAICGAVVVAVGRKRRIRALAAVVAGYHLACWSISGRTVGGALMRQRVVAVDGSRASVLQSALRLALLPVALLKLRAVHDEVAATDVIADPPSDR